MRVAVIGAGPAGATAAYELAKKGIQVELFEAGSSVGGLARSIQLWGQTVDIGPHRFFSNDARVNRLWLEVVGKDYRMVDRLTRLYYNNRFFLYPLSPSNALKNLGLLEAGRCTFSYLLGQLKRSGKEASGDFESWVVGRFGRRLFELFFKTYSEKLWGISCRELDADFAVQRIKKFSLGEAIRNAFGLSRQHHKTLVDRFAYPTSGSGMVYERMVESVLQRGGSLHLRTPVAAVLRCGNEIEGIRLSSGQEIAADHIISTMPLTLLVRSLGDLPAPIEKAVDSLTFRNTILVYLLVDRPDLFPDQWLYVHSSNLGMGRVTNFRNWVPELCGSSPNSILALEYWCYEQDALWSQSQETLVETATREIQTTGLLKNGRVLDGHVHRIPRSYPVYRRGYKTHLQKVVDYLEPFQNLTAIGRYGSFKYNNQDHSILMGILAAEKILTGGNSSLLWGVNTDYDSYQEEATITETGLESTQAA